MLFTEIIEYVTKNFKIIATVVVMLLFIALLQQISSRADYKSKFETAQKIGDENLAAIKDNSIQLKVTKSQLKTLDSNLFIALNKNDSLLKIKSKVITIIKPVYIPTESSFINDLKFDTPSKRYGLTFNTVDSIKMFNGITWFKLIKTDSGYHILPDSTEISNFKFNFVMVTSQYDDPKTKLTKAKITPYYIDSMGNLGNPISEKIIKFDFRNIEILDKPYVENVPINSDTKKSKYRVITGWGLSLSPLAIGMTTHGWGYTPNIGISYCILLNKR